MKINNLHFAYFLCICSTFASVMISAMDTALAQISPSMPNQSVLNGLYSPTASERFFEEGKKKIEKQTLILVNPERYKPESILKINIVNTKIIEELEQKNPILNFPNNGLQK